MTGPGSGVGGAAPATDGPAEAGADPGHPCRTPGRRWPPTQGVRRAKAWFPGEPGADRAGEARERASRPSPAPRPGDDGFAPRPAGGREPVGSPEHPHGTPSARDLGHPVLVDGGRRAVPGHRAGLVPPGSRGRVTQAPHDGRTRDGRPDHGGVPPPAGPGSEASRRPRQPVRQPCVSGSAQGVRHGLFDEPPGQWRGSRAHRERVQPLQAWAGTWRTSCQPCRHEGHPL